MSELPFVRLPRGHALPGCSTGRVLTPLPLARAICARLEALPLPDALWPIVPRPWERVREVAVYLWGIRGIPPLEPLRWKD